MSRFHRSEGAGMALLAGLMAAACQPGAERPPRDRPDAVWRAGPALPSPVTNNAVAAVDTDDGVAVFSFLGMDSTKVWSGVTSQAFRWDTGNDSWQEIDPVPGPGRLASTAQVVDGRIYVIGGYTVGEDGSERSVPDVNVYDPETGQWDRAADIPVPTDDAVAGVWRGSHIVLVSGWHDDGNVADVQVFDAGLDKWTAATSIPGAPVFGHAGAVVGDRVVYVDGVEVVEARTRFAIAASSWIGGIDPGDPSDIEWEAGARHPGAPLYRAGGGNVGNLAIFVGGTDNPYNYNGIGYDGTPAVPLRQVLAFDPRLHGWRRLPAPPSPSMDHRNVGVAGGRVFLVGGMHAGQIVTGGVWYAAVENLLAPAF